MLQRIADGRTDLVFEYVAAGQAATAADAHGTRLIQWCAHHGDVSAIRFLLDRGESLHSLGDNFDLNGAAFHGHWRLCQFLIERGADPNRALADTGETPLHAACSVANRPWHDDVVQVLVANGASPNQTTLHGAPTGAFMRDATTKGETPLHRAAAFASERAIRLLLDAGARKDARDMHGESPLAWASWHLRPAAILRALCYDGFTIHPGNQSTYDHGGGWSQPTGKPHV
jgi:ankyrin repeat protein